MEERYGSYEVKHSETNEYQVDDCSSLFSLFGLTFPDPVSHLQEYL